VYSILEVQPPIICGRRHGRQQGRLVVNRYSVPDAATSARWRSMPRTRRSCGFGSIRATRRGVQFQPRAVETKPLENPPSNPPSNPPGAAILRRGTRSLDAPPRASVAAELQPSWNRTSVARDHHAADLRGGGVRRRYSCTQRDRRRPAAQESSGDEVVQVSQSSLFDPIAWTAPTWIRPRGFCDKDGTPIKTVRFGMHGATPVTGDWDGSGRQRSACSSTVCGSSTSTATAFGTRAICGSTRKKGDQPVTGDWNGDGKTDIGILVQLDRRRTSDRFRAGPAQRAQSAEQGRPKNVPPIRPTPPSAIARSRRATSARCDRT